MPSRCRPDKDMEGPVPEKKRRVYMWPSWWDDKPHPNVPFPKFYEVLGDRPGPREILRRAEEYAREHGEG